MCMGLNFLEYQPQVSLEEPSEHQLHEYLRETAVFLKEKLDAELVVAHNYRVCMLNSDDLWS